MRDEAATRRVSPNDWARHATAGAVGAVAGVTFAVLVAEEAGAPFVGSIAVDAAGAVLSPADLSTILAAVGEDAKTLAFSGALVGLFLVAVVAWIVAGPRPSDFPHRAALLRGGFVAEGIFAVVVGATAATDIVVETSLLDQRGWFAHMGLTLGIATVSAGGALVAAWSMSAGTPSRAGRAISRRRFIHGAAAFAATGLMSYWVSRSVLSTTASGVRSRTPRGELPPPITPTEQFYVVSKNLFDPQVDSASWTLRVGGLVERPLSLKLADLTPLGDVSHVQTLVCISNEVGGHLISTARWRGVPLVAVLDVARVSPGAAYAVFHCADGYTDSLPLAALRDPRTRLVWEMNGAPLTRAHGFPLRLLVPGRYGLKNPKWIQEIELTPTLVPGYWQQRGWSQEALIRTMSRIDVPAPGARSADPLLVQGIAFAGDRGISAVTVSGDAGASWQSAELRTPLSSLSWSLWETRIPQPRPSPSLVARAVDGQGSVQDALERPPLPSGSSGLHRVSLS